MVPAGAWTASIQECPFSNLTQQVKGDRWFEGTSSCHPQNIDYIDTSIPDEAAL